MTPTASQPATGGYQPLRRPLAGLGLAFVLLLLLCLLSLAVGARIVSVSDTVNALLAYDGQSADHIAIRDYRLPRTLLALFCGAGFGVAGALIQATTRNPIADPGLLGVNAGAMFFVTIAVAIFGLQSTGSQIWFAFSGAILVTVVVYTIGASGRDGPTPIRLLLAGVAMTAVLSGVGTALNLLNPLAFDAMRVWSLGSLAGRGMDVVSTVAPFIAAGLALAVHVAPALNSIALGDDLACSLGTRVIRTRLLAAVAVTLLAGGATAAVGPIGFIGLMAPHVVKWLVGPDQRLAIAGTMIVGPVVLLASDILGRLLLRPGELEAGIVTAVLGAPLLILLVQRRRGNVH